MGVSVLKSLLPWAVREGPEGGVTVREVRVQVERGEGAVAVRDAGNGQIIGNIDAFGAHGVEEIRV